VPGVLVPDEFLEPTRRQQPLNRLRGTVVEAELHLRGGRDRSHEQFALFDQWRCPGSLVSAGHKQCVLRATKTVK